MPYMLMQRFTSAVHRAYAGRDDVAEQRAQAARVCAWLESLELEPALRAELIEPIRALQQGFDELQRSPETYGG